MSRFQINEEEYEAIKTAEKATKDKNTSRRLRVLMMRYEGKKVREISEITGMRINSISPKDASEEACEASKKSRLVCWKPEKTCSRTFQEVGTSRKD